MNEAEFRELISIVEERFSEIGAPELADEGNYALRDPNTDEERLLDPQRRLIEMLLAFDRYMAAQDGSMFQDAMQRIRENVQGDSPARVTFSPVADTIEPVEYDLSNAPNLSGVRFRLESLIRQLHDEPLERS